MRALRRLIAHLMGVGDSMMAQFVFLYIAYKLGADAHLHLLQIPCNGAAGEATAAGHVEKALNECPDVDLIIESKKFEDAARRDLGSFARVGFHGVHGPVAVHCPVAVVPLGGTCYVIYGKGETRECAEAAARIWSKAGGSTTKKRVLLDSLRGYLSLAVSKDASHKREMADKDAQIRAAKKPKA